MEEILFAFPGLIGLFFFVWQRTPWPGREWYLSTIALFLSGWSLGLSHFLRYGIGISYWDSLSTIINLFQSFDSDISFMVSDKPSFLSAGVYSFSFIISVITAILLNWFLPDDLFQNPDGKDYADFLRFDLVFVELNNRKVYVGKMMEAPLVDTDPNGLITLVPLMSGHRNQYDEVVYTNFYPAKELGAENLVKIEISFPIQSLVSLREFSVKAFERFKKEGSTIIRFKT